MENSLPLYQHPTLTIFIDDNQSYLDSIVFWRQSRHDCRIFSDPRLAIDWLKHEAVLWAEFSGMAANVCYDDETASLNRRNVQIDLDDIGHVALNPYRFNVPAVVVVDYAMPSIDGLQLCEAIRDLPCRKILLTGQADEKIAVEAFNNKIIDHYIRKAGPDALDQLELAINEQKKAFFIAQARSLGELLARHSFVFLDDPAISALVQQHCQDRNFVEFYLYPNPAGILFFDAGGRAALMVIATDECLTAHCEVAAEQGAPAELLSAMRTRRMVPFFHDSEDMYYRPLHSSNWPAYCAPSTLCRGRQDYYWAMFDFPINKLSGSVCGYAEFLGAAVDFLVEEKVII